MAYTPSPRPQFDGPTHIRYDAVPRHLWGDEDSGQVADWIYVSNGKIHQIVFGLPGKGVFRHSDQYRTIFAADEVYYVLSGVLVMANPETGEVYRARPGEAIFFRRDTWHHGFNYSTEPLRVLEYFAPPPLQGTSGAYARTKTNLTELRYAQDEWLGHWNPLAKPAQDRAQTMRLLREDDVLWRLEGQSEQTLVSLMISTEHLTVGQVHLMAGQNSQAHAHAGDESVYLLEGTLNIRLLDVQGTSWFELNPGDGFYIPEGVRHQYYNITNQSARLIFGVAPCYLAPSSDA